VADLGCGSGAIGLSVAAEVGDVDVWLTDVSVDAVAVARANLTGLGVRGRRTRIGIGSWFEALPADLRGSLDVLVSNPPYIASSERLDPAVAQWEPADALFSGSTGTEALEHIVDQAAAWLAADGALVLEMAPTQTEEISRRAAATFADVEVMNDLAGRPRAVVARRGGAS